MSHFKLDTKFKTQRVKFYETKSLTRLTFAHQNHRLKNWINSWNWLNLHWVSTWETKSWSSNFETEQAALTSPKHCISMRQLSEFFAPTNWSPENSDHWSQLAGKAKIRKPRKDASNWFYAIKHNAALRGECRLNQPSTDHFHHQNQPHTKNATRHESLLNALLA